MSDLQRSRSITKKLKRRFTLPRVNGLGSLTPFTASHSQNGTSVLSSPPLSRHSNEQSTCYFSDVTTLDSSSKSYDDLVRCLDTLTPDLTSSNSMNSSMSSSTSQPYSNGEYTNTSSSSVNRLSVDDASVRMPQDMLTTPASSTTSTPQILQDLSFFDSHNPSSSTIYDSDMGVQSEEEMADAMAREILEKVNINESVEDESWWKI
ncbi:hypothetical protein V1511DRAFT_485583 [Dipodascopsis uninucleata]